MAAWHVLNAVAMVLAPWLLHASGSSGLGSKTHVTKKDAQEWKGTRKESCFHVILNIYSILALHS